MRKLMLRVVVVELIALGLLVSIFTIPTLAEEEYQITAILQSPEPKPFAKFGISIAVSEDMIVIGEHQAEVEGYALAGKVYVFDLDGNLKATLHAPTPQRRAEFGGSVAISGDIVVVGEAYAHVDGKLYAGRAYIFDSDGNLQATLQSPEPILNGAFGRNVAISNDTVVVTESTAHIEDALQAGKVYVFDLDGNLIAALQSPEPYSAEWDIFESQDPYYEYWGGGGNFGFSMDGSGGIIVVGEPYTPVEDKIGAGKAFIFDSEGNLLKTLQAPEPQELSGFGKWGVDVNGDIIVVGEYYAEVEGHKRAGRAYIFDLDGNLLAALQSPEPEENAEFGCNVATSGDLVIVGEPLADVEGVNEGKVYVFDLDGNLLATLLAPAPAVDAEFGWPVAVRGDIIVVGENYANLEEAPEAGRVHVFRKGMVSFEMSSLSINPSSVKEDESITISADVTNTGTIFGSHTITLKIDDEFEDEKTVTLNPDESTTVSFEVPATEEGSYSVDVNGLTGSYEVRKAQTGIPGFPIESIILGLAIVLLVQWLYHRRS